MALAYLASALVEPLSNVTKVPLPSGETFITALMVARGRSPIKI